MDQNHFYQDTDRILESQEISENEHNIIKGDTVGETLYSAKWILNTLISLSKVYEDGWNNLLENDLCTLWDMTVEKDVVEFLLENNFFKMAEFTIKTLNEPRLIEIIIGIIGNMCCEAKSLKILESAEELVSIILSLISSDDKETLIQIMRILRVIIWDIQANNKSLWLKKIKECKILGEAISFILNSSTCDELLRCTIDIVYLISGIEFPSCHNFFEHIFDIDQLIFALCESIMELINQKDNCYTELQLQNIENWLNILFNIIKKKLLRFSDNESDEKFIKILAVLIKILQPYENLNNLMPSEEKCLLCIEHSIKMVSSFQKNEMFPNIQLIKIILKIIVNLEKVTVENEFEDYNHIKQLQDYAINYWIETLEIINKEQIIEILQLCDYQILNTIIKITNSLIGVQKNSIIKLLEAKSVII